MRWEKRGDYDSLGQMISQRDTGREEDLPVPGLREAADLIISCAAAYGADSITVVGDYDADGIVSTINVTSSVLDRFGARPRVLFPRRFSDGYGLNTEMADKIEAKLLVTVDNGIAAVDAIRKAKEKGMQVVVIDHHQMRDDGLLPPADVIVDPHVTGGEFTGYCAAGLTFKLARMITDSQELLDKLLVLTGIATVADVVPLLSENRAIVKASLSLINQGVATCGLRMLLGDRDVLTDVDYGFFLGPVFNAAGRMIDTGAMAVFNTVSYDGPENDKVREFAEFLLAVNRQRKELSGRYSEEALQMLGSSEGPVVLLMPEVSEGLVGIVAGRISEELQVPSIVLTVSRKDPGVYKGSGRSAGDFDLKAALDRCKDHLKGYGGHKGAAGLTVAPADLEAFREAFIKSAEGFAFPDRDVLFYDAAVKPDQVAPALACQEGAGPYGEAFERPIIKLEGFEAEERFGSYFKLMGKENADVKVFGPGFDLVMFGMAERYRMAGYPRRMDVLGEMSYNHFGGRSYVQVRAQDFMSLEDRQTPQAKELSELLNFL